MCLKKIVLCIASFRKNQYTLFEVSFVEKLGMLKKYTSAEIENSRISIGFECLDRELFKPEKCYALLGKTGVKHARCQTGWVRCETEKGKYDFAWLDDVVDNLRAQGVTVWFNVGYGNPLYMDDIKNKAAVGCAPLYYGDECLQAWENYVSALAAHFAGRVQLFELWNEPESLNFWYPSVPDPKEYARLYRITAAQILKHIPDAKLVATTASEYDFDFIEGMFEALRGSKVDYFAYHAHAMYPEICHSGGQAYLDNVAHLRSILDAAGFESTKLIQGEAGQPSWAPEGHWLYKNGFDNPRAQAVWLLRRYCMDFYADVALSSFFMIADIWEKPYEMATKTIPRAQANGILNGLVYTPKPSYAAMQHVCALFRGEVRAVRRYFTGEAAAAACEQLALQRLCFEKDGLPMYVYYLPSAPSEEFYAQKAFTAYIQKPLEAPVLVDLFTGAVYALDGEKNAQGLAVYADLPLANYPMVLTERAAIEVV